jgi:hypothetical protein
VVKYYGFTFPPVGIIDILKQVAPANSKIYILDPIGGVELPYAELDADSYVIITTNEGASHRWFDRLIDRLQVSGVPLNHIVIRSCCLWDPNSPVLHIHTIVDECSDFISNLKNYTPRVASPTHHFVCLNHLHRWQRYQLVKEILDRELDQFGRVSYLQKPNNDDARFPLVIDQSEITWEQQRNITMPALTGALFNIICETAYESDTDQLIYHHLPGMTEKSYKCFALFQIPVWLAPYQAVACYRYLGFDVFDDIVDHGYDLEPDPIKRIDMVADQIENIVQLNQLTELKTKLIPRFEKNWQRLQHYAHNFSTELPQWQTLFLRNNSI